ncbi:MAG: ABC transporter substrate-binding protein [Trueperaceae bacterium]
MSDESSEIRLRIKRGITALLLGIFLMAGVAVAQDCGGYNDTIVFGEQDWDSAQVHNAIARHILEEGFGCRTSIIPGSTIPMQQGTIRGDIDVLMEVWMDNIPDFLPPALESGQIVNLGINYGDGQQGFFVPRYVIEGDSERGIDPIAPDLVSVADIGQYSEHFRDPEQPDKGRFYNCIIGWVCEEINTAKLEAYGISDEFTNFRPGTGIALSTSMEGSYLRGEPWFGYYWGPTWVLGKLDMVQLEEPEYTEECWEHLTNMDDPEQACAYPASVVTIMVNGEFAENVSPDLLEFLSNYNTTSGQVSGLLAYMQETDALPEDAAQYFLETETDVWTQWLPEEVAERVQDSL